MDFYQVTRYRETQGYHGHNQDGGGAQAICLDLKIGQNILCESVIHTMIFGLRSLGIL